MKFRHYIFCALTLLLTWPFLYAADFDYSHFDSLLSEYVRDGLVDYQGIKNNPSLLQKSLSQLENLDTVKYKSWGESEKMAFWINAYNAITIYGVIKNYPVSPGGLISRLFYPDNSIRQIPDFFNTSFGIVMGNDITLDEIEHEILREEFDEPRIHFALVCASISCPRLQSRAYDPDSIDTQLERVTEEFIQTKGAVIDRSENRLLVSKIFDWYAEDFQYADTASRLERYDDDKRGFMEFILDHSPADMSEFIIENSPGIKFVKYDWSLNELKE